MNQATSESELERLLKPGEALVFSEQNYEGQERLITTDSPSLGTDFPAASIRIGPKTGVTIFSEENYQGLTQELTAELPSFTESRLQDQKPKSLKIWSTIGRPFIGYWAIEVAEGGYLSVRPDSYNVGILTTSKTISEREGFRISDLGEAGLGRRAVSFRVRGAPFAMPIPSEPKKARNKKQKRRKFPRHGKVKQAEDQQSLTIQDLVKVTLVEEPEAGFRKFSLLTEGDQWICYDPENNDFLKSADAQNATLFCRSIKLAEDEKQVGELLQGEAALYENPAYWGKTWIFHTYYADFNSITGLNDTISSIQLGPWTGATIYREAQFKADDPKAGKQDIISNIPSLKKEQVGEDQISSINLWQIKEPASLGVTFQCRLSQDFRGSGETFEEYSAYRTTLRLPPTVETVDIWTTDETDIQVDEKTYHVDEDHPVTLQPNLVHCLVITTNAIVPSEKGKLRGTLSAPGLKIRTNTMQPHERIMIFPDREVHERLSNLQNDELWNATYKDKDGSSKPLIDQNSTKQEDVASAQEWIKKVTSTVKYSQNDLGNWEQAVSPEGLQGKAWALDFSPPVAAAAFMPSDRPEAMAELRQAPQPLGPAVKFREMSQADVGALIAIAKSPDAGLAQWWFFDNIVQVVKDAVNVVIAKVNEVVTVIVKTALDVFAWVVETAQKAVAFVEAIFEKIGLVVENVVNWLKYVFNWDDILQTRDYLRESILKSLDYVAKTLAPAAKEPVKRFFETQKHILIDKLDDAIVALGGTVDKNAAVPSVTPNDSSNGMLDTVDWILSKVFGGGMGGLAFDAIGVSGQSTSTDGSDEKLRGILDETLAKGSGSVAAVSGGVSEVINTLVKSPDKPLLVVAELLKLFHSLAAVTIEIVEDIILGLLDLVIYLIEQITRILTEDIRIPFFSDLLKWVGLPETLGFSLLDAVTLILAIPFTVVYKALFHKTPFQNVPSLALEDTDWWEVALKFVGYLSTMLNGAVCWALDMVPEAVAEAKKDIVAFFERLSFVLSFVSWLPSLYVFTRDCVQSAESIPSQDQPDESGFEIVLFCIETLLLTINFLFVWKDLDDKYKDTITLISAVIGAIHIGLLVWTQLNKNFLTQLLPSVVMALSEPGQFLKMSQNKEKLEKNPSVNAAVFGVVDFSASVAATFSLVLMPVTISDN